MPAPRNKLKLFSAVKPLAYSMESILSSTWTTEIPANYFPEYH